MTKKSLFVGAIWLVGVLFCVVVIVGTRFSADMSAFLPRSPSPTQQILVDQMESGVASRLMLVSIDGVSTHAAAALSKKLAARVRQDPAFVAVHNGDEAGSALAPESDLLWRNRYLLSPNVTSARFTTEGLHRALEVDLALLGSDLGSLVKQHVAADPTGEFLALIDRFAGQSQPARRDGVWFSPDGQRALLVAQTRTPGFDIAHEEQALASLKRAFLDAQRDVPDSAGARLQLTGPGVFAVHTKSEMKEDISRLTLIATLLVSAILLFAYRSPRVLALALVPVASGALAGIAAVSLGFGFVHGITLGFGVTLIGEAVDYAIYLFTQTAPGTPPEATLPRIWPMLRLGVLISVCGFSAMLFSSFTGFAQLGLFSIVGLVIAVAVTRWVLPALLPRNFATARSAVFAPALLAIVSHARFLRLPVAVILLGACALLAFHRGSFWEDDLASLSPIPVADQKLDRTLRADIGTADVRYVVVASAPGEQQALAASERLSAVLEELGKQGLLAGFDAPTRYLPSAVTQRARLDALPASMDLRARLVVALRGTPFRPDLFEPFIAAVAEAKAGPLLDRAGLQATSLGLKLDSLLFERRGVWTSLLSLRGVTDPALVAARIDAVGVNGAVFVDLKAESDRLLKVYRREALMLALIGSLVIVVLLALSLRSPPRIARVVAPLAGSVVLTTAILTVGGHKLSIFNLIGLLLTVAVGSNYCIFFERQDWSDANAERMVASLVLANICTTIGFGILSFARLPALHGIGMTVAIGAFLSLVFAAIVTGRQNAERIKVTA
jgi:predicted exporter